MSPVSVVSPSSTLGGDSFAALTSLTEDDGDDCQDSSDVFLCARQDSSHETRQPHDETPAAPVVDPSVTLFVYGWHNVQPGPLSWVFPSLRAALDAVRKMKNAVEWSIVAGNDWRTIDEARAKGAVLVEQLG